MTQIFFATLILVGLAVILLGVRVFFVKGGRFPNTHVGGSKAMRERGISCVSSQDRQAQAEGRKRDAERKILKNKEK
jgi:hypothetical protein